MLPPHRAGFSYRTRIRAPFCLTLGLVALLLALPAPFPLRAVRAAAPAARTTAINWYSLKYFFPGYGIAYLPTGTDWPGAKYIINLNSSDYQNLSSFGNGPGPEPFSVIWAHTCAKGAQIVHFTRTVLLPGRPATIQVSYAPYASLDFSSLVPSPVTGITIQVNGSTIFHSAVGVSKTASNACNTAGAPLKVGFGFEMFLTFHDDLIVPKPQFKAADEPTLAAVLFTPRARNVGPSDSLDQVVNIGMNFYLQENQVSHSPGFRMFAEVIDGHGTCSAGFSSLGIYQAGCRVVLPVGAQTALHIGFHLVHPPPPYDVKFKVEWTAGGSWSHQAPYNSGSAMAHFCAPPSSTCHK